MKKIIILTIAILIALTTVVYAKVGGHASHVSHSSSHTSSKSTVTGAKTYTTPKNFTSKYNTSNIKTEKVQEASNYSSYSATNMFRPNFWTAMWVFACMNNNSTAVTEQDIAKELEERGYTQEEIQDILKEGEEAKQAQEEQDKQDTTVLFWIIGIIVAVIIVGIILLIILQ